MPANSPSDGGWEFFDFAWFHGGTSRLLTAFEAANLVVERLDTRRVARGRSRCCRTTRCPAKRKKLFGGRQGRKNYWLMLAGLYFDDKAEWEQFILPKLDYLATYEP